MHTMKTRSILSLALTLVLCAGAAEAKGKKEHKSRDTNQDGLVSVDEFLANRKHPDKAKAVFEKADANKDGKLDKPERKTLKKHGKKHAGKKGEARAMKKGGKKKQKGNG